MERRMSKTNIGLADFMEHCADVHRPYIYGTFGLVLTEQILMEKAASYSKYLSPERVAYAKKHYIGKRTDDCNGGPKNYIWLPDGADFDSDPVYNSKQDLSADDTFAKAEVKGKIDTMPDVRGICVRYPGHTGVYVGNGIVCEFRGFDYGCVRTKLSERKWTDWYQNPFIEYVEEEPSMDMCSIDLPVIRKGMKCKEVGAVQTLLNLRGYEVDVDDSDGPQTDGAIRQFQSDVYPECGEADGVCGTKTWTKLIRG